MVVQHNMQAMNANRTLGITTDSQKKVTEKLSSGYKVNRAADDAAGLTISEKMRSQIRGLTQASSNAQDGISCVQTAEGALTEVHSMLQRMNELAVKAANGTNTSADRMAIEKEVSALSAEITRVAQSTQFNTLNLLNGSFAGTGKTLQVGTANVDAQRITIKISAMNATVLGVKAGDATDGISVSTEENAKKAISKITMAIARVSAQRSDLGAVQNRLEHTIANLDNVVENTTAAESQIRDTDMAKTMVEYTKNNILAQAGTSMLAQANQSTQNVLSLLQ
ncbi:MAG: flagellin [Lachnospiraceae bacterium]|nr:flagellin [Lachnospiraceae bacterium]